MNAFILSLLIAQCGPNGCPAPVASTPYTGWHEGKYYKDGTEATAPEDAKWRTTGVQSDLIPQAPKNSVNGKEVSQAQAFQKLERGLTDRSAELRTTVVLKDKAKVKEVEKALEEVGKTTRLKVYTAGDPMIPGFPDGDTVIIQQPHGKVLHMGPYEQPEKVVEAVRRANANFDPSKAPDLLNQPTIPYGWLAGGVALLLLILNGKKADK